MTRLVLVLLIALLSWAALRRHSEVVPLWTEPYGGEPDFV